jgi:hypothetical protein
MLAVSVAATITVVAAATPSDDEQRLRETLDHFWGAIQVFDLFTAYQLEAGAHDGALTANNFREQWTRTDWELRQFEVKTVDIDGDEATVELTLTWDPAEFPRDVTKSFTDRWRLIDGQWYRDSGEYRDLDRQKSGAKRETPHDV